MRRSSTLPAIAALAALAATLAAAPATYGAEGPRAAPAERVIVTFRDGVAERAAAAATRAGDASPEAVREAHEERARGLRTRTRLALQAVRPLSGTTAVVRLDGVDAAGLDAALARLRADPAVAHAEPDLRMHPHLVPSDPGFQNQWYLQAITATANGTTASATNAAAAWDLTRGSRSVVIAVLDTGVRFDHPDLGRAESGGKLLPGYDFVSTDPNGQARTANDGDGWDPDPSDPGDWISQADKDSGAPFTNCDVSSRSSWHGTRVSGIVAAATNNGIGVAGTGFDSLVQPVRVLGKCGGYTSDIIAGMRWAAGLAVPGAPANPNPAQVLNLSLGGDGACSGAYQAAVDEIVTSGRLVIVSAGNDGSTVDAPANCRGVAAIGALRHVGNKVGFSNLGRNVALSAPGGNCVLVGPGDPCLFSIDTTTNLGTTAPGANGYTDQIRANFGTSFSAPIVAGIAGLLYARHPGLTPPQAIARLRAAARPFPVVVETDPFTNQLVPTCRVPSGESDTQLSQCNCTRYTCGAGTADAERALAAASSPIAAITVGTVVPGQAVQLSATASSPGAGATLATYAWSVLPGATGAPTLGNAGAATTTLAVPATGALAVQLLVTDTNGGRHTADLAISSVVPSVLGQTRASASSALDAAELALGTITTQTSATVAVGGVISQAPVAGSTVASGTPVAIVISSGPPPQATVPAVVGQPQGTATTLLANAGLGVGTVTNEQSATVAVGTVISQSPAAGASVASGTGVNLVVSSGPPQAASGSGGGGGGGGALDGGALGVLAGLALLAGLARRRRAR